MAIPVCPFEEVVVSCQMDEIVDAGGVYNNSNSDTYVVDGAGNYFNFTNCNAAALINAYESGLDMDATNDIMLQTVDIGCAEIVEIVEECIPDECTVTPTCASTVCEPGTEFEYINLDQDGTNAAGFPMGNIEMDNIRIGSYEFVFSDLDINEDGRGTTFGGWDNDGGTMLLRLDFCDELLIQELDIRNLEVGSEVSVGTMASTMDAASVLSGLTLSTCDDPSGRMSLNDGADNLVITDGPGCGANPNATYNVAGGAVSTLWFKYHNPPSDGTFPSRCRGDYVGFKIGACVAPVEDVIPSCPLSLVTITMDPDDVVANGVTNANTDTYVQDSNGVFFDFQSCTATALQNAIDNMTPVAPAAIGPCAEVVAEEDCTNCPVEPICMDTDCGPDGEFSYISLEGYDDATNTGFIELDGAEYGTFEVLTGDNGQDGELDVNVDANGQIFGAFDNNGGTLLMKLEFCEPLSIDEFTIRGLEVMSEASIGTAATTEGVDAVLSGITLMDCDVHPRMTLNDGAQFQNVS